jgi:hypothetical protein
MALPSWITLTPSSGGAGNTAVTATAQRNTGREDRSATFTIRTNEGGKTKNVAIFQGGANPFMDVRSWDFGQGVVDLTGNPQVLLATGNVDNSYSEITLRGRGNLSSIPEIVLPNWIYFRWWAEYNDDDDDTQIPGYGEENDYNYHIYLTVSPNTGGARSGDFYVAGVFPPSYVFGEQTTLGFTFTINQASGIQTPDDTPEYAYLQLISGAGVQFIWGDGDYGVGDAVVIKCVPQHLYKFVGWYNVLNNLVSTEPIFAFRILGNTTLFARCEYSYETGDETGDDTGTPEPDTGTPGFEEAETPIKDLPNDDMVTQ